ncbi:hypothetical protein QAD02_008252 [Eretmocerus hayati]|uniref:Uncharacterized protein n=1 Tax=Eretmocerus hayati TaxID=131215 RepID=A0ACC2N5Y1_9HYME|nr:hypothetical protein QAD02_008252 [Eretmocerus hayati]
MQHSIIWTTDDPPTTGIVEDKDFRLLKTKAKARSEGTWFNVELIKSSNDRKFLDNLEVDVDGRIITPKRKEKDPNIQRLTRRQGLAEKKQVACAEAAASLSNEEQILGSRSIFDDESSENESGSNTSRKLPRSGANKGQLSISDRKTSQTSSKKVADGTQKRDEQPEKISYEAQMPRNEKLSSQGGGGETLTDPEPISTPEEIDEIHEDGVSHKEGNGADQVSGETGAQDEKPEEEMIERDQEQVDMEIDGDHQREPGMENEQQVYPREVEVFDEEENESSRENDQEVNENMEVESLDEEEEYRRSLVSEERRNGMVSPNRPSLLIESECFIYRQDY